MIFASFHQGKEEREFVFYFFFIIPEAIAECKKGKQ